MRILHTFFAASMLLLAACGSKDSTNTSGNSSTTPTNASAPDAAVVQKHAENISTCLCPHLGEIAAIAEKAQTAPAEEREAYKKQIDDYPEPACVAELDALQKNLNLTAEQEKELEKLITAEIKKRCGEDAAKIGM